jgi:hypothetical protein
MDGLWRVLLRAAVGDESLSCEDCFILMDHLSELLAEGQSPEQVLPLVEKYLPRCSKCERELQQSMADLLLVQLLPE